MEFKKKLTITLYAKQEKRHRLLDSVGEGERGMFRENGIETNILSRVKHDGDVHSKREFVY